MTYVHIVDRSNKSSYDEYVEQSYRIRHEIYVKERRWLDLDRPDGREIDQFDTEEAVYLLAIDPGQGVVAGTRLVPTMVPHLMSEVFPELANVRGLIRSPDAYEWTRIFVVPARRESGRACLAAGMIYCAMLEYCLARAVSRLSVVCEAYWLPRLAKLGWRPKPLGEPLERDGMTIVGLSLEMTLGALDQTRSYYGIRGSVLANGSLGQPMPVDRVRLAS